MESRLRSPESPAILASELKKILFVAHEASRTGATIFLLHFLDWLKKHSDARFVVALKRGGVMVEDFRALAPTFRLDREMVPPEWLQDLSVVHCNTATNGRFAEFFAKRGVPVVTHVHELRHEIELTGVENQRRVFECSDRLVACSSAVRRCLQAMSGIDPARIPVIHEMVPVAELRAAAVEQSAEAVREELKIPPEAFVVGCAGTVSWRKGADLFLQLAGMMRRDSKEAARPVYFVWIGSLEKSERRRELEHDLGLLGLTDVVRFTGEKTNPHPYYQIMDQFCLFSREDPFPLVMIEAGALGKPVLAFEGSGGAEEFCEVTGGALVGYGDLPSMADRIREAAGAPVSGPAVSPRTAEAVAGNYDTLVVAPRLLEILEDAVRRQGGADRREPAPGDPEKLSSLAQNEVKARLYISGSAGFPKRPHRKWAMLPGEEVEITIPAAIPPGEEAEVRFRLEPSDRAAVVAIHQWTLRDGTDGTVVRDFLETAPGPDTGRSPAISFSETVVALDPGATPVKLAVFDSRSRVYTPKIDCGGMPKALEVHLILRVETDLAGEMSERIERPEASELRPHIVERLKKAIRPDS